MLDCYGNAFCLSLCHTLNNPESQLNTWQSISVALFIYLCYLALILLIVFSSFFIFSPFSQILFFYLSQWSFSGL